MTRIDFFRSLRRATVFAACLAAASQSGWAQHAACGGRCQYGVEGSCTPKTVSFGHYQATWRRWPEPAPPVPAFPDGGGRLAPDRPAVELPTPLQEESTNPEFPHIRQRQREQHRSAPPAVEAPRLRPTEPALPDADPFRDEAGEPMEQEQNDFGDFDEGLDAMPLPLDGRHRARPAATAQANRRRMPPHLMRAQYQQARVPGRAASIRPTGGETSARRPADAAQSIPTTTSTGEANPLRDDLAPVLTPRRSPSTTSTSTPDIRRRGLEVEAATTVRGGVPAPVRPESPAPRKAPLPRPNPLRKG